MKFYSGFSLKNEQGYFKEYMNHSDYCAAGFSYGAIKALLHVKEQLAKGRRIDVLQLFSPAFFSDKGRKVQEASAYGLQKE